MNFLAIGLVVSFLDRLPQKVRDDSNLIHRFEKIRIKAICERVKDREVFSIPAEKIFISPKRLVNASEIKLSNRFEYKRTPAAYEDFLELCKSSEIYIGYDFTD